MVGRKVNGKMKISSRAVLRGSDRREAGAAVEAAEQGRGSVRAGADSDCDLRRQHEHHLGEGYVHAQSSDFREGFDSEGIESLSILRLFFLFRMFQWYLVYCLVCYVCISL